MACIVSVSSAHLHIYTCTLFQLTNSKTRNSARHIWFQIPLPFYCPSVPPPYSESQLTLSFCQQIPFVGLNAWISQESNQVGIYLSITRTRRKTHLHTGCTTPSYLHIHYTKTFLMIFVEYRPNRRNLFLVNFLSSFVFVRFFLFFSLLIFLLVFTSKFSSVNPVERLNYCCCSNRMCHPDIGVWLIFVSQRIHTKYVSMDAVQKVSIAAKYTSKNTQLGSLFAFPTFGTSDYY